MRRVLLVVKALDDRSNRLVEKKDVDAIAERDRRQRARAGQPKGSGIAV